MSSTKYRNRKWFGGKPDSAGEFLGGSFASESSASAIRRWTPDRCVTAALESGSDSVEIERMEGEHQGREPVVETTSVKVLYESGASYEPDDKLDYPPTGTNSIYSAILSRNEAVKDAKRLKSFLELRDKYVAKGVIFEDPLFPADDSSLFYSQRPSMKIEWKRPSVSTFRLSVPRPAPRDERLIATLRHTADRRADTAFLDT